MLEWSLFLEHREGSSKGKEGGWRNFLVKYPEAGAMHRKMLRVSARLAGLEKENGADALAQARAELYKGQCNCAYWHGVFGGLYLFHLRRSVFHHLLACEKEMDAIVHGAAPFIETLIADHGGDGDDEVIVANGGIVLLIDPSGGGAIREISSKKVCHNIMNTMTRRKEPYHARIIEKIVNGNKKLADCKTVDDIIEVGDPAIGEHLIYDRYPRASLVDHFLDRDVLSEDLGRSSYDEKGDLWNGRYTMMVDKKAEGVRLVLEADGKAGGSKVRVSKKIDLGKDSHGFSVEYTLTNTGEGTLDTVFGAELNIALPHADSCMYTVQVNGEMPLMGMKDRFDLPEANSYYINDGTDLVSFRIDILTPCRLVSFPVKTVSQSERQYELNYQGTGLFLLLAVSLGPGEIQKMVFRIDLTA
jgi:alpha-amylase